MSLKKTCEHVTVKQKILCKFYLFVDKGYSDHKKKTFLVHDREPMLLFMLKVRQSQNDFLKLMFPPKKRTNEFYFTTMKPQVDLFSFVFGGN